VIWQILSLICNILKIYPLNMKPASTFTILASLLVVSSLQAKWSRIPIMQERPVNVAVKGPNSPTSIDSSSGVGQVDNLINQGDSTAPATLSPGNSFFIVNFGKPVMVSTSSLVNDGIEGKVSLSASADKVGWAVLEEKVFSAADRSITFKFAGIQAKFLKFEFVLSKGGTIRGLNVIGAQTDRGYALKQDPKGGKGQPMNFSGGLGGGRLVYAAPKPVNGIDSAAAFNKFEFPESDEKYRTLIYDMGQVRIMNEFSSVHSPSPVRFEVFAFEKLPEKEDWRGRLAFNPADFSNAKPVVAYEDKVGTGNIKVKPQQPVKTRYLALRWEPDFNPPAFLIESTGAMGNAQVTGPTTTTTVVNGQTVTVTVDPGPAVGAGTSEAQASVTVTTTAANGTTSSVTYSGLGVTGALITPTGGVQIMTGNSPNSTNVGATPPAVATISVNAGGGLTTQPTAVGFVLGVAPTAASGTVTPVATPPAGDTTASNPVAQEVVASVLGLSSSGDAAAVIAAASGGGDAAAMQTAVVAAVGAAGGDATQATAVQTGATGSTTSEVTQNNANNILNGALNQTVTGGGSQNQVNPPQASP
jgi:hypothetical protein